MEKSKRIDDNKKRASKIGKILEIPKEIYSNMPTITIVGFEEMTIDNFKGILEYEEFFIRINTNMGIVSINGFNLNLENMNENNVKVSGTIEKIELEKLDE